MLTTYAGETQVALANNGSVYVADGYCNARVVEYGPDGTWRGSFELPAPQKMQIPHSLAIDECQGELYVADREAGLVHAFDLATRRLQGALPSLLHASHTLGFQV